VTNWKRRIDIKEEMKQAKTGEISPAELGQIIANKLKGLPEYAYDDLKIIVIAFEDLPKDAGGDEFDEVMEALYDWGDTTLDSSGPFSTWTKQCWIATF